MKALLLAVSLLFATQPRVDATKLHAYQIRVDLQEGYAHACPIGPNEVLTSEHVVRGQDVARFESLSYEKGRLVVVDKSRIVDLALARPEPPLTKWYAVAKKCPVPGDKVYQVGYERDDSAHVNQVNSTEATVTNVLAGMISMDDSMGPGSSGSCILNAVGEVVGINESMLWRRVINQSGQSDQIVGGTAVGICGEWFKEVEDLRDADGKE